MHDAKLDVKPYHNDKNMCGPVCLYSVIEFYGKTEHKGKNLTQKYVAELCEADKEYGTTVKGMRKCANDLGFSLSCHDNSSLEDIKYYLGIKVPVIVDWFAHDVKRGSLRRLRKKSKKDVQTIYDSGADGHYCVVTAIVREKDPLTEKEFEYVLMNDPEFNGIRKIKDYEFYRSWFDFKYDFIRSKNDMILRRMIVVKPKKANKK